MLLLKADYVVKHALAEALFAADLTFRLQDREADLHHGKSQEYQAPETQKCLSLTSTYLYRAFPSSMSTIAWLASFMGLVWIQGLTFRLTANSSISWI